MNYCVFWHIYLSCTPKSVCGSPDNNKKPWVKWPKFGRTLNYCLIKIYFHWIYLCWGLNMYWPSKLYYTTWLHCHHSSDSPHWPPGPFESVFFPIHLYTNEKSTSNMHIIWVHPQWKLCVFCWEFMLGCNTFCLHPSHLLSAEKVCNSDYRQNTVFLIKFFMC